MKGLPNRFVYGTTKAAVIGLTKAIAADYRAAGHPLQRDLPRAPWTRPRSRTASTPFADPVQARKDFVARQPMGRLATARRSCRSCVYLASDEATFVTGQRLFSTAA